MRKGKILRDTQAGPGLASADGQQFIFTLEEHWRSDTAPRIGMAVELALDAHGTLQTLHAVDVLQQAQDGLKGLGADLQQRGLPVLKALSGTVLQRVGLPTLAGMAALALGWLVFSTLTVRVGGSLTQSLSLRDLLKLAHMAGGLEMLGGLERASTGWTGWLLWLALLAPLLPQLVPSRWAGWGLFAPLGFMLAMALAAYFKLKDSLGAVNGAAQAFGGAQAARMAQEMADAMFSQMLQAMSLGLGFYLATAAALWLAVQGALALRKSS
jgi:hypothetical protein